jgi:uncharacterized protein (TIGR00255 family)
MSLRSMTGFGQAESTTPSGLYHVEIRGVNNRYLELQLRIPKVLAVLEPKIKKLISQNISRGSILLLINWDQESTAGRCTWNKTAAADFVRILKEIKKEFSLVEDVSLSHLLEAGDLIKVESVQHSEETLWKHLSPILNQAVANFQQHRESEARFIEADLNKMVKNIEKILRKVELRAPARLKKQSSELQKRIASLVGEQVDQSRLATEIALMADRLDISEECTRLRAHIEKYRADVAAEEPAGKRLGFLLQEMNREANTIGSKANDAEISHLAIELKEIIEKIREQIQNIE